MATEAGHITGTQDKDYNIIWFVEQFLSNALRLDSCIEDADRAGDGELAEFFRRAQAESRTWARIAAAICVAAGSASPATCCNCSYADLEVPVADRSF